MKTVPDRAILIVDDHPANLKVISDLLQQAGFRISVAKSGESALRKVREVLPELILLDVMMPGIDGYETCRRLKANPDTQEIPVIFLSSLDQVIDKVKAFDVGGIDYITKPFQTQEVLARVQSQMALRVAKAELDTLNAELEQRVQQRTAQLAIANQALQQEINERKQAEELLRHGALYDALTDCPNRTFLMERLQLALKRAQRHHNYLFSVLFIDLDRFKVVNDSLGHQVGDQLLIAIARQLEKQIRSTDVISRLGGDEFVILLDPIADLNDAIRIAERIAQVLKSPFDLNNHVVYTTASIGIVLNSANHQRGSDLLRDADIAMYRAKAKGKAQYEVFDQEMYTQAFARLQLESDLRQAIEQQGLQVYYQPIVSLGTGTITGFEALIRWQHPQRGWLSPTEFIPLAEETGLIIPLGESVLYTACQQMTLWISEFPMTQPLRISVNLSATQLRDPDFLAKLDRILNQTGLTGQHLQLELTESILMEHEEELITLLLLLKTKGIKLSIDDFGTGYSCLSYLHRFPVNTLKIDRSFISRLSQHGEGRDIVETIIHLAHQLGIAAIAEGVESKQQLNLLQDLGCEQAQGYLFSKPLPPETVVSLLANHVPYLDQSVPRA